MGSSTGCVDSVSKRNGCSDRRSPKLQIIPFRASHMIEVNPEAPAPMLWLANYAEANGVAYTGCVLGVKLGCAGIAVKDFNVGELWAVFNPYLKSKMKLSLFRVCRELLEKNIKEMTDLKVIYALCDYDDKTAQGFLSHLHGGFKLKRYQYELIL